VKRDGLFDDIPLWMWAVWAIFALAGFALTGAVIWLIFAVGDYLSSH